MTRNQQHDAHCLDRLSVWVVSIHADSESWLIRCAYIAWRTVGEAR
jgi:hypothetical protein